LSFFLIKINLVKVNENKFIYLNLLMHNTFDYRFTTAPRISFFKKLPNHKKNQIFLFKEISYDSKILSKSYLNLPNFLTFNGILKLNYNHFPEKVMNLEENLNNLKNVLNLEDLFKIFSYYIFDSQKVFTPKVETQLIDIILKFSKKFQGKNIITEAKLKNILEFDNFRNLMKGNVLNELFYKNSEKEPGRKALETNLFNIENKKVLRKKTCLKCFYLNSIFFTQITLVSIDISNQNFFKKFVYFLKRKFRFSRNYLIDEAVIFIKEAFRVNIANKFQELLPI